MHPSIDLQAIEQYVEGTLSPAEAQAIAAHAASCPACANEILQTRTFFARLADLPSLEPSPHFADRVMRRVAWNPEPAPDPALASAWLWGAGILGSLMTFSMVLPFWILPVHPRAYGTALVAWVRQRLHEGSAQEVLTWFEPGVRLWAQYGPVLTWATLGSTLFLPIAAWTLYRLLQPTLTPSSYA